MNNIIFESYPKEVIEQSNLNQSDKYYLNKFGFPTKGNIPVIYNYYKPIREQFPMINFNSEIYVGIAYDIETNIYISILVYSGFLYFLDKETNTLDFLNSSYKNFIECVTRCNSFFIKNSEFTKNIVQKTNSNILKLESLKAELYRIDKEIEKDENNAWNVFIEELHSLLE